MEGPTDAPPPEGGDTSRPPVAVDIFSGAGGLAEGLEAVGVRVAAAVELHPQPALTHAFNHPHTTVFAGDIRELDLSLVDEAVALEMGDSRVDVVVGGPPCQGFSTAGKMDADDPRNGLFRQFVRVVEHFAPAAFVLENVPGFKTMHGGAAYREAKSAFEELNYDVVDTILNAEEFGTPQRRRRFVMVGARRDLELSFDWPTPTHYDAAKTISVLDERLPFVTVEAALSDIAFLEPGWEAHRQGPLPAATHAYAFERRGCAELLFNHLATRHRPKAVALFQRIPEGQTVTALPKDERPRKVTMARMARSRISNAVLALPDDMIHYLHHRIPTVREMARLQSFDDDYVFIGKRTSGFVERRVDVPQYTQVGNAVPPLLGRALGRALLKTLQAREQDLRDLPERARRHAWVRGSSGFSGYTLGAEAEGEMRLRGILGQVLPLPISDEDIPVMDRPPLEEWTARANPRRGQWVPDTKVITDTAASSPSSA